MAVIIFKHPDESTKKNVPLVKKQYQTWCYILLGLNILQGILWIIKNS